MGGGQRFTGGSPLGLRTGLWSGSVFAPPEKTARRAETLPPIETLSHTELKSCAL